MKTTELKRALLDEFDRRFGDFGLTRHADEFHGDRYDRVFTGGRESVHPAINPFDDYLVLDAPYISLRLNEVEDLIARFEEPKPHSTISDIQARSTIGFRMEPKGVSSLLGKRWTIKQEKDAFKAGAEFVPRVMAVATRFWEEFSGPEEVLKLLSGDLEVARRYTAPDIMIAERAIALGLILGGPDLAHEIWRAQFKVLTGRNLNKSANEVERWVKKVLPTAS